MDNNKTIITYQKSKDTIIKQTMATSCCLIIIRMSSLNSSHYLDIMYTRGWETRLYKNNLLLLKSYLYKFVGISIKLILQRWLSFNCNYIYIRINVFLFYFSAPGAYTLGMYKLYVCLSATFQYYGNGFNRNNLFNKKRCEYKWTWETLILCLDTN